MNFPEPQTLAALGTALGIVATHAFNSWKTRRALGMATKNDGTEGASLRDVVLRLDGKVDLLHDAVRGVASRVQTLEEAESKRGS